LSGLRCFSTSSILFLSDSFAFNITVIMLASFSSTLGPVFSTSTNFSDNLS
jgi:hypothetical protein